MHNRSLISVSLIGAGALLAVSARSAESLAVRVIPYRAPARMPDVIRGLSPSEVRLVGYLGTRVRNSATNRLAAVEEEPLLAGFQQKPGAQAWIGEHVGKWLHAATLAWANTGNPELRTKLDRVAVELMRTQGPDGYLGTYAPDKRFGLYPGADWDVWVHKYDLLGLLTYYRYTGNEAALYSCRKVGDLLIATFGPGKKSILAAGTHVGMAATSVLEPMVLLYRTTGEEKYLDFARYLVSAWDEPNGPRILQSLDTQKSVSKTANGKAYEMLSNLVGLCELARATGERRYLEPVQNAWDDIVANEMYVTGSASYGEHFHSPHDLPNQQGANVGETCVTVTWIQLNEQLLRITGEARYGDELERSYYNHLAAAQRPDGAQWCYYTSLEGIKPYGPGINCCVSSGPRGMAMAPSLAYLKVGPAGNERLAVNLFDASHVTTELNGHAVTLEQQTSFPLSGGSTLVIHLKKSAEFGLQVRSPGWAEAFRLRVPGEKQERVGPRGGWVVIPSRRWKDGERVQVSFEIPARRATGEYANTGRAALLWGPLVLAYDQKRNPELPSPTQIALEQQAGGPAFTPRRVAGEQVAFEAPVRTPGGATKTAVFVPFAEAGSSGGRYQVWLVAPGEALPENGSLFADGRESRSRAGNAIGSIIDGDPASHVVTWDRSPREEDWFAVERDDAVVFSRVVFAHGRSFHDGGWWDASGGKPRVQVQRVKGGPWETVGALSDYPSTTSTDAKGLRDGQTFSLTLAPPVHAFAVRVIGKPACGDTPTQAFASCAELQAFAK